MKKFMSDFWPYIATAIIIGVFALCPSLANATPNVTNTVLMVDQNKNLNVEGIASVEDVATNAVQVQIAQAAAQAAQNTARGVTNAIQGVIGNIMSNNVVVYRSGFTDSFAALVIFTENDKVYITDCAFQHTADTITAQLSYVCTADIHTVKPTIMGSNTCTNRTDFTQIPDGDVTDPVWHPGTIVFSEQEFTGYYTTTVTVRNCPSTSSYFMFVKVEADTPSGEGTTLDLPNGVTGGATTTVVWGDKELIFRGGVLTGVNDAN